MNAHKKDGKAAPDIGNNGGNQSTSKSLYTTISHSEIL
jgi:hypothetical protein